MRVCVSMVVIEDKYRGDDGRGHHEHDAVKVCAQERHCVRRSRHRLRHHIQKHRQRQQNRYTCIIIKCSLVRNYEF